MGHETDLGLADAGATGWTPPSLSTRRQPRWPVSPVACTRSCSSSTRAAGMVTGPGADRVSFVVLAMGWALASLIDAIRD
jgi:hypothetical protein